MQLLENLLVSCGADWGKQREPAQVRRENQNLEKYSCYRCKRMVLA